MLLAFDVGTSVLKAGLFARDGTMAARAEAPLELAAHADSLRHESDPAAWIRAVRSCASMLLAGARGAPDAVIVSGNGPTVVAADAQGGSLGPALSWMDRRAVAEAAEVSALAGFPIDPSFFLPKALWLHRHRAELCAGARWLLPCPEYVELVLTGVAVTFLPGPRYARYIWEAGLVGRLGMDAGRFPPFVRPGEVVGKVSAGGEKLTGIPRGTAVVAGAPDFLVSLLGTGTVRPGRACDRSGTSEGINLCCAEPREDPRLLSLDHIVPGLWNLSGIISTSGKALEWFRAVSGRDGASWEELFAEIAAAAAGADGLLFLPYLAGERTPHWDPLARGSFVGLTLGHGRAEMTRAVAESVGFAIRDVIGVMEETGLAVRELRITGRPSRSPVWNQMRADVTGKPILVPALQDADLAGDACLALAALGEYGSASEASDAIVRIASVCEPDAVRARTYDELFPLYRDCYRGLKDVFAKLSNRRSGP